MSIETLTTKILSKMPKIGKRQRDFIIHLFWLFASIRGRTNFENMARQGGKNEGTYRNNFDKAFDFLEFNQCLIEQVCDKELIVAFDPCFISKSGKHTAGIGYFWSGCASRAKRGLEICGFSAVDVLNNTAMHLTAKQTLNHKGHSSLLDYYADLVLSMAQEIRRTSKYLVADAYFSKSNFVNPLAEAGLEVISRLRDDAVLFYPYLGLASTGKGRPRKFAGRVNINQPDEQHFKPIIRDKDFIAFESVLYSKSLKRWIKVVLVQPIGKAKKVKIYFSTDCAMEGSDILCYYKARFQIEFIYRDAKQFTGLEQCQSRKEKRLDFHFNAALTTISLAKALHYLNIPIEQRKTFSMSSIKTQYFNELLLDRFFSTFGNIPKPQKNHPAYLSLRDFGKIAA
jgi:hypothetical protein